MELIHGKDMISYLKKKGRPEDIALVQTIGE